MPRFLTAPRWLVGHALVLVVVVLFVNFGFWQLRRLEEVRALNALVSARLAGPPRPLDAILADAAGEPAEAAFHRATVSGRYLPGQELLVGPRTRDGRPGYQLLTPLDTGGRLLLVDRGWVPYELDRPPVGPAAPPDQPVRLTGIVHDSRPPPRFAPQVPAGGDPDIVSRVDLPRLQPRFERPLYPVWLQLQEQVPPQPDLPLPTQLPELDEGNHLSYAVQWFAFATIALVGYMLLLGKNAREERATRAPDADVPQPEVAQRRP